MPPDARPSVDMHAPPSEHGHGDSDEWCGHCGPDPAARYGGEAASEKVMRSQEEEKQGKVPPIEGSLGSVN